MGTRRICCRPSAMWALSGERTVTNEGHSPQNSTFRTPASPLRHAEALLSSGAYVRSGENSAPKIHLLPSLSLALVTLALYWGCAGQPTGSPSDLVESWASTSGCTLTRNGASPEMAERGVFRTRFIGTGSVYPMNVRCVTKTYSARELSYWAARGDPVAYLAETSLELRRSQADCTSMRSRLPRLIGDGRKVWSGAGDSLVSRTPESLRLASEIERFCGNHEAAQVLLQDAISYGYADIDAIE